MDTVTPEQKAITLPARANNNLNSLSATLSALRCREMSLGHSFREGTFFLGGGGGLGPQRGGSPMKVSTKRGGPYLM